MGFSFSFAALVPLVIFIEWMMSCCQALHFVVINNARGTDGGNKFDAEIGQSGGFEIMNSGSKFIWDTFPQQSLAERKNVQNITLTVESMPDRPDVLAYTSGDKIHLKAEAVSSYKDVKKGIRGVLYHELAHVWQWTGNGKAPTALTEGIADYVRLTAGLVPSDWVKLGEGDKWDQGYDVTAYFLQYCESISSGFVANMNAKLASDWSPQFFNDLTGKSVDQLWSDYKAKYASSS